uniref:hypothetical protein n=1 Tax=Planococcus sp. (in: firmicutes) TaxID=1871321 RepID=UPI0015EF7D22|nr:hypothetical protein [Planococcus sp. (in: firmicutes)]
MESSFRLAAKELWLEKTDVRIYSRCFEKRKKSAAKEKRTQETQGFECIIFSWNFSFTRFSRKVNGTGVLNVT